MLNVDSQKCTWSRCTYHSCKCQPLLNIRKFCVVYDIVVSIILKAQLRRKKVQGAMRATKARLYRWARYIQLIAPVNFFLNWQSSFSRRAAVYSYFRSRSWASLRNAHDSSHRSPWQLMSACWKMQHNAIDRCSRTIDLEPPSRG